MNDSRIKRPYRNNLDFIEAGFRACWRNAKDLVAGSKNLMAQGLHAPALSLAILALEEIGKVCAIDGLLFARSDDQKAKRFGKSQRDHDFKLIAIPLFAFLIRNISRVDPRNEKEQAYGQALAIGLDQLYAEADAVSQLIPGKGFAALNEWKQKGFYVGVDQNCIREAV